MHNQHAPLRINGATVERVSSTKVRCSLARIAHCRAILFFDKAAVKTWDKLTRKKLGCSDLYIGGAKYLIAPSIAHRDWVVYTVNIGDKPMCLWLLVVTA